MILPIIDGWRLFAVQQLGLVIRISSKLMTAGTLFFFFEGQSLIKLNICNPYVGTCGLQQGGFFLCCWYDMHQRLINITQGGEELNRNKNVYTLRGKGWKIQRNLMYFNYIQEPYFLAVNLKCSYVGRCFGENVFWTHDLRRLHGVSIGRNPYPCRPMAWISFVFECNRKFISMTLSKTETNSKGSEH